MRQEFADHPAETDLSPLPIPAARADIPHTPLRVLALSASSGGGHDGTARALHHLFEAAHPGGIKWQRLDVYARGLKLLPWLARMRHHTFSGWALFNRVTEWPWILRLLRWALVERLVRSVLARIDPGPDVLIATHFAAAQILDAVASRLPRRPLTVIVATDYYPHRAWFAKADVLMVSREPGLSRARQIVGSGQWIIAPTLLPCLPAAPRASRAQADGTIRILAVMGADGTSGRRLIRLLRALSERSWSTRLQLEVVCGRNEALQRALNDLNGVPNRNAARSLPRVLRLQVTGYATDLPQRLAAADLCLLRASPLVMTEALAAGTAVLAFDWHAHEAANAQLIEQWACGRASKSIPELVNILQDWMERPWQLASVQTAARNLAAQSLQVCEIRPLVEEAVRARRLP